MKICDLKEKIILIHGFLIQAVKNSSYLQFVKDIIETAPSLICKEFIISEIYGNKLNIEAVKNIVTKSNSCKKECTLNEYK